MDNTTGQGQGASARAELDKLCGLAAKSEREEIILMLGAELERAAPGGDWSDWRKGVWAICHPFRFGKLVGLSDAIRDIYARHPNISNPEGEA